MRFVNKTKHIDGKNPLFSNSLKLLSILFNPKASIRMITVDIKPFQKDLFVKKAPKNSLNWMEKIDESLANSSFNSGKGKIKWGKHARITSNNSDMGLLCRKRVII